MMTPPFIHYATTTLPLEMLPLRLSMRYGCAAAYCLFYYMRAEDINATPCCHATLTQPRHDADVAFCYGSFVAFAAFRFFFFFASCCLSRRFSCHVFSLPLRFRRCHASPTIDAIRHGTLMLPCRFMMPTLRYFRRLLAAAALLQRSELASLLRDAQRGAMSGAF